MNKLITLTVLLAIFGCVRSQWAAPSYVSFFASNDTGSYEYTLSNYSISWAKVTDQIQFNVPNNVDSLNAVLNVDANQNYYLLAGEQGWNNNSFYILVLDKNANVVSLSSPVIDITSDYQYNQENVAFDSTLNVVLYTAQDDDANAIVYVADFANGEYSQFTVANSDYVAPIGAYVESSQTYYIINQEDSDNDFSLYTFDLNSKSLSPAVSIQGFSQDFDNTYLNYADGNLYIVSFQGWPSTNFTLYLLDQDSGLAKQIFTGLPAEDSDYYTDFWFVNNYVVLVSENDQDDLYLSTINLNTLQLTSRYINNDFPFDEYYPSWAQ